MRSSSADVHKLLGLKDSGGGVATETRLQRRRISLPGGASVSDAPWEDYDYETPAFVGPMSAWEYRELSRTVTVQCTPWVPS